MHHTGPRARLKRLQDRIKDEPRDKAGNLARKWSSAVSEIAECKAAIAAEDEAKKTGK